MRICLLILVCLSLGCKATLEVPSFQPAVLDAPLTIERDFSSSGESAGSVAPEEVVEPEQAATPVVEPDEPVKAPVKRNTLIQYTIKNCRWCFYDREKVIPNWVKKGWKFPEPVDESANPRGQYPRYEIYDANGNMTKHEGSLISLKP
jgi:hypothetical protein